MSSKISDVSKFEKILVKRSECIGPVEDCFEFNTALSLDTFINTLHLNLAKKISKIQAKSPSAADVKINVVQRYDYIELVATWSDEESKSEHAARVKKIEREEALKKAAEEKEYAEYLRLKGKIECQE